MRARALVRRLSLSIVISFLAAPVIALGATDNGTLTVGHYNVTVPPNITISETGYLNGAAGFYSPT